MWHHCVHVALSLLALLVAAATPVRAVSIELKDVAPDRIERQRAAKDGTLALPGTPDTAQLDARLAEKGFTVGTAVFIRVFKAESELEVWMRRDDRYELFATYPICYWSGTIGPKVREGDKQNPEGFYTVSRRQLHRSGRWRQSLNLGFPNALDRQLDRSGSYILVHGGCSSVGCFAMTDAVIAEIYKLTEAALKGGQEHIDVHVFPFRMTEENLTRHHNNDWAEFWRNIKEGYDSFERTRRPPAVSVCDKRYVVRDSGPGEVAGGAPLASCGGPAAATKPDAQRTRVRASLPPPSSNRQNPPQRSGRTSSPPLHAQLHAAAPGAAALAAQAKPTTIAIAAVDGGSGEKSGDPTPRESTPPKCASTLASCRKFVALRSAPIVSEASAAVAKSRRKLRVAGGDR